jgi:ribosomal-protein-alanine N-acetyltransferase
MMPFVSHLFARRPPTLSEAEPHDAAAIAELHAASFRRGWDEVEVQRMLVDRAVVAHRATFGRKLAGFIMSRLVVPEAEILSVAIDPAWRGRGFARPLLELHLRRLYERGAHRVFLEVDEHNAPAVRLYQKARFYEVGRRQGYYDNGAAALVLRRDLG